MSAKISQLSLLPQGQVERTKRVLAMIEYLASKSKRLEVRKLPSGGKVIAYRAPPPERAAGT